MRVNVLIEVNVGPEDDPIWNYFDRIKNVDASIEALENALLFFCENVKENVKAVVPVLLHKGRIVLTSQDPLAHSSYRFVLQKL